MCIHIAGAQELLHGKRLVSMTGQAAWETERRVGLGVDVERGCKTDRQPYSLPKSPTSSPPFNTHLKVTL